jgi:hypothetical protein
MRNLLATLLCIFLLAQANSLVKSAEKGASRSAQMGAT